MAADVRSKILLAAGRVVARDGAKHLTLEAVAIEAKLSKGGLLYHFATKQALVAALVEDLVSRFEKIRAGHAATGGPGAHTSAYLWATFDEAGRELDKASAGVAAAVANDPSLLEPLRVAYRRWQHQLTSDGIDPVSATIVRLAVDGLWFSQILGIDPLPKRLLTGVIDRLGSLVVAERAR